MASRFRDCLLWNRMLELVVGCNSGYKAIWGCGMRRLRATVVGAALFIGTSGIFSYGQMSQPFPPRQQQSPARPGVELPPIGPVDPISPQLQEQQERSRNSDRQKRLVADTDKLLTLATQLKQDVDKSNKDVLSVDVVKKADEIEKLAHSVKERMKG
jgi:hypothetical protein